MVVGVLRQCILHLDQLVDHLRSKDVETVLVVVVEFEMVCIVRRVPICILIYKTYLKENSTGIYCI